MGCIKSSTNETKLNTLGHYHSILGDTLGLHHGVGVGSEAQLADAHGHCLLTADELRNTLLAHWKDLHGEGK